MKLKHWLLAGYFLIAAIGLTWPGYSTLGNGVEPYILGLPMSFAWVVGWVVLTFCVLSAFHFVGGEEEG